MPFVNCPACGKEVVAPRDLIGLEWDCPKCGAPFIVREDDAEPAGEVGLPSPRRREAHPPWVMDVP